MKNDSKKALVIGAGPSGLCVAKHLLDRKDLFSQVDIVEQGNDIGGTFRNKSYEDGKLVSSTYITAFSDLRWDEFTTEKIAGDTHHPTIEAYVDYLDKYVEKFALKPHIKFNRSVVGVKRLGEKYNVFFADQAEPVVYDYICLCSGLHHVPLIPDVFKKVMPSDKVMHSLDYKKKSILADKRVLIVGCGETAMDIAYHATGVSKSVGMVIRRGFLAAPTRLADNVPLDTFITNLFECCYIHPYVERFRIKQMFATVFFRAFFKIFTGRSVGFNQWVGGLAEVKRGYHIINKQDKALPYLNRPFKNNSWLGRNVYKDALDDPNRKTIDVKRYEISDIVETKESESALSVTFSSGKKEEFDLVVLCTGYDQKFCMDLPHGPTDLPNERNIVFTDDTNLGYFGFVRPNVGAIPPMSELQVFWWLKRILNQIPMPLTKPSYLLMGGNRRVGDYGVDYGNYMHDLGRDMGAAPNLLSRFFLLKHPKALVAYTFGQAFISFFRLQGDFANKHSLKTAETELYQLVLNRGWAANLIFLLTLVFFGFINLAAWGLEVLMIKPFQRVSRFFS